MTRLAPVLSVLIATASAAQAIDIETATTSMLADVIRPLSAEPVLIDAVASQNMTTADYDSARIDALDRQWRAEVGSTQTPTIEPVVGNPAAEFLRGQVAASGGTITEIFVMDGVGLNVAASGVTSDYWQGDEAKFTETVGVGPDAVHVSDIEFDESTQNYSVQISIPLLDAAGDVIGAMTVGLDAEALM